MSLTNRITEKWCEDHRLGYLGRCPFCEAGVEPVRFTEARQDFAGVPLAGTRDILPHMQTVALEDIVRVLGRQLAEIERRQIQALQPYEAAKKTIFKHLRKARMDPKVFNRAIRVYLELPGHEAFIGDPQVRACLYYMKGSGQK